MLINSLAVRRNSVTSWYENHWPSAGDHKIYFDRGTVGYDSTYEPGQAHMDSIMEKNGFMRDDDWKSLVFRWRRPFGVVLAQKIAHSFGISTKPR